MRTFTDFDLTVKAFDTPVWAQQRNLLQIHVANSYTTKIVVENTPYRAEYMPDEDGNVTVDVSDLVRSFAGGEIEVTAYPDEDKVTIEYTNEGGLINPAKMIVPPSANGNIIEGEISDESLNNPIMPPTVNLKTCTMYPEINRAEVFLPFTDVHNNLVEVTLKTNPLLPPSREERILDVNALEFVRTSTNYRIHTFGRTFVIIRQLELMSTDEVPETLQVIPIIEQQLEKCKQYACVQWIARSGQMKRATWEVRKVTDTVDGSYEILRDDNAYDVRKGQQTTLQLVLENLDAYDFWYYSDIVTSSDVRVMLFDDEYDETNDTIIDECRVEVTDKKVQQIDGNGGKFNTLKVNVNYKRYDTI